MFSACLLRQVRLQPLGQFAARQQHAMLAGIAFQADIRTEAHHRPLIRAAGMWFSQAYLIV